MTPRSLAVHGALARVEKPSWGSLLRVDVVGSARARPLFQCTGAMSGQRLPSVASSARR